MKRVDLEFRGRYYPTERIIMMTAVNVPETMRPIFENFKSEICHEVISKDDQAFIFETEHSTRIQDYFEQKWSLESFYLLAMLDYLCRIHNVPNDSDFDSYREYCFDEHVYPVFITFYCKVMKTEEPKNQALEACMPEFRYFNIIEVDVRNIA